MALGLAKRRALPLPRPVAELLVKNETHNLPKRMQHLRKLLQRVIRKERKKKNHRKKRLL
jgi:uncharacterized protein (DUF2267 family)